MLTEQGLYVGQSVNPRVADSSFQPDLDFEVTIFKSLSLTPN